MLVTDLEKDPFQGQLVIGIYGGPKVGKTTAILDLARNGQIVIVFSIDRGLKRVQMNRKDFQGKLFPVYIMPTDAEEEADKREGRAFSFTRYLYKSIYQVKEQFLPMLARKGVSLERIWMVIDTYTHLQAQLLHDGSEAQIEKAQVVRPLNVKKDGKQQESAENEEQQRVYSELTNQPEWGANLSVLTKVMEYLYDAGCNIVLLALEKEQKTEGRQSKMGPAVQGASYSRFVGDVDILLHLEAQSDGRRFLHAKPSPKREAGDRFSVLPPTIELERVEDGKTSTLLSIRQLVYKQPDKAEKPEEPKEKESK